MTQGAILACALLAVSSRAASGDPRPTHVRSTDPRASILITEGADRSPVLQSLVHRLEQSNVLVYVEYAVLPSQLTGRLVFVSASGGWRYVRVQIECRQNRVSQTTALGHELQHAVEIADAGAGDTSSVRQLYNVIGFTTDNSDRRFETSGAQDAAVQIRRDLYSPATAHGD